MFCEFFDASAYIIECLYALLKQLQFIHFFIHLFICYNFLVYIPVLSWGKYVSCQCSTDPCILCQTFICALVF